MADIIELFGKNLPTPVQQIIEPQFEEWGVQLFLKRDDLVHPEVSGNKWRKIKYNLLEAQRQKSVAILTFGGAFSNHIAATASACRIVGLKSIGIIRGEELSASHNPTLRKASQDGMFLEFISRKSYRRKAENDFLQMLKQKFGDCWIVPEGGANHHGMKGCAEMMDELQERFDVICVACGTGTTMAGIVSAAAPWQQVIGFPVLKDGRFIISEMNKLLEGRHPPSNNYQLMTQYHFGGYACHTPQLLTFMNDFEARHHIMLDFIYTGKMMYGIYDLIQKGFFKKGSKILAVHTGGLQGNVAIGFYPTDNFV